MSMMFCKAVEIVVGDRFVFGGVIVREITEIKKATNPDGEEIKIYIFDEDLALKPSDPLWKLARPIRGNGLPERLQTALLECGNYICRPFQWTPKQLLRALLEDVATLQAAGVREEDE